MASESTVCEPDQVRYAPPPGGPSAVREGDPAHSLAGDDHLLDLARAVADLEAHDVPEVLLKGQLQASMYFLRSPPRTTNGNQPAFTNTRVARALAIRPLPS